MAICDLTMYRRTKWIVDDIRAKGYESRMEQIKTRAISLHEDYAQHLEAKHLTKCLTGDINAQHFATILKGQLIHLEKMTRSSQARGKRHSIRNVRKGTWTPSMG